MFTARYFCPILTKSGFWRQILNTSLVFNVHGSVYRKNILIYVQQDATLHSLFYLETALHVSGGDIAHHQERIQLYLQHLVFVTTPLLLPAAIAAGSSNGTCAGIHTVYICVVPIMLYCSTAARVSQHKLYGIRGLRCLQLRC
jgi:hypothetical protein